VRGATRDGTGNSKRMDDERIVIVGAGPVGLGAGYRLHELGCENWAIYEKHNYVGGQSASFIDDCGFTWDVGGHVLFSRYDYFDKLYEVALQGEYLEHVRKSYIRLLDTWVPYPFQNNIRRLPHDALLDCVNGLLDASTRPDSADAASFEDWIYAVFGDGIASHFMVPYNEKAWVYPLELMSTSWVANSVSVIDTKRVLRNIILDEDDVGWGPNSTFKFPRQGGTGTLFRRLQPFVEEHLHLCKEVVEVHVDDHRMVLADGSSDTYDALLNSSPLDEFVARVLPADAEVLHSAGKLKYNGVLVVGVGLERKIESDMCWIYFPGPNSPFYRVTYLSNYSPHNVPDSDTERYSSIMCEVAYAPGSRLGDTEIVEQTIEGLVTEGLLTERDRGRIVSTYVIDADHAYPIPTLDRDDALRTIQSYLESHDIYSRGRHGAWRYETSSMDHAVMMGVEIVDRLLNGKEEQTWRL